MSPFRGPLRVLLDGEGTGPALPPTGWPDARGRGEATREVPPTRAELLAGARRFLVLVDGWHFGALVEPAERAELRDRARRVGASHRPHGPNALRAQIPGRITAVRTAVGDRVEAGQPVLSIEAMKMENEVRAPRAGTIVRVAVAAGALVELGDELVVIE